MSDDAEAVVIEWEQDQANTGNVDFVLPTDILIELYVDKTWYDKNNELNIRPDEVLVDIVQRKGTDKRLYTKSLYRLVISARFYTGRPVYSKYKGFKDLEGWTDEKGYLVNVLPIYKYDEEGELYYYYFQEHFPGQDEPAYSYPASNKILNYIDTNHDNQSEGNYPKYSWELSEDGERFDAFIENKMKSQDLIIQKVDENGQVIETDHAIFNLEYRRKADDGAENWW